MTLVHLRCLVILYLAGFPDHGYAEEWHHLYTTDGIEVYQRNTDIPTFRAIGEIDANMFELLAVMADMSRRPEWVTNLEEVRTISGDPESAIVVYNRFNLPWPAQDRDSYLRGTIALKPNRREVEVTFQSIDGGRFPPVEGVTRVLYVFGRTRLRYVNKEKVHVEYEIAIDVGGQLPQWIVKFFVEDAPIKTLRAMQAQCDKTRGQYLAFIRKQRTRMKIP